MISIKLIKHHPSRVLAHVYEHMVCNQIKDFMYLQGLFKVVDFALDGTALPNGLIVIDIELYSEEAEQLSGRIPREVVINEKTVGLALMQVSSEETAPVYIDADFDLLTEELTRLDKKGWQTIDEYAIFDQESSQSSDEFIYLTQDTQPQSRTLDVSMTLTKNFTREHRDLLPLFDQIASMILMTVQDQLSLRYGVYTKATVTQPGSLESVLSIHHKNKLAISSRDVPDLYQEVTTELRNQKAFDRVLRWLSTLSYETNWYEAPSTDRVLEDTGVLIGAKGWRQIATMENIEQLLSHAKFMSK